MSPDNWGHRARFGIFIVGAEVVPEAEWWAMLSPGVSVHASRVTAKAPWATWQAGRRTVSLSKDLERGADQFATMALSAVSVAHSSSSVVGGAGWDDAVTAKLSEHLPPTTAITTNGADCLHALEAMGAKRPMLVFPPWFGEAAMQAAVDYMHGFGVDPAGTLRHTPDKKWHGTAPEDLYRKLMHIEQSAELLRDQIAAACPNTADGVLIVGTGLRCVAVIDELEMALGLPVITANQASLWRCLSLAGIKESIRGYGRLLSAPR